MIVVIFGLPGSGKSYLAKYLSGLLHADYISSDVVKKELFSYPSYSECEKKQVYDEMLKRIAESECRKEVVVDSILSDMRIRQEFISKVKNIASVYFIEVTADEVLIKQRLSNSRYNNDAEFDVYEKIKNTWVPFEEPHLVLHSTNDNIAEMLDAISDYIFSSEMSRENILQLLGQRNFSVETKNTD